MRGTSYSYIESLKKILDSFPHSQFDLIVGALLEAYENNRHVFVMGNGGSGATASHFACDINKGTCARLEKKFKVICLNDSTPTIMAYANDYSYEDIFVEQMKNFFKHGDVIMGISGSGNSENVLKAIRYAGRNCGKTIGISGYEGGELAKLVDISLIVQSDDMQKIEDVHMICVHIIMQTLDRAIKKF